MSLAAPAITGLKPLLVTGGAGFIGSNLADRLAREGEHVLILDALARRGVEQNISWLKARHSSRVSVIIADIRDAPPSFILQHRWLLQAAFSIRRKIFL